MRKLTKGSKPPILVEKEVVWTNEYAVAVSTGAKPPARWTHAQIKLALLVETGERCAYCEGFVKDVGYLHVEHILPRSARPDLVVAWDNLTGACQPCNGAKSDYYDTSLALLNPYTDDPDAFLTFLGNLIWPRLGSPRGEITILTLDLNRLDLAKSRRRRLEAVHAMLEHWQASEPLLQTALEASIRQDIDEGEFTASVRAYVATTAFPLS